MKNALIALLCAGLATLAHAQGYPSKPVRIVAPFGAGSTIDIIGRLIAPKLTDMWGQQVIVDPRSGAGGIVGTDVVAKAAPDGYTLLMMSASAAILPAMVKLPPVPRTNVI